MCWRPRSLPEDWGRSVITPPESSAGMEGVKRIRNIYGEADRMTAMALLHFVIPL